MPGTVPQRWHRPHELRSEVIFTVWADRQAIPEPERGDAWIEFSAKPRACLRSSDRGPGHAQPPLMARDLDAARRCVSSPSMAGWSNGGDIVTANEDWSPRLATAGDAGEVARLLHDFNVEFDTPTPGVDVIAGRLRHLLAGQVTFAILAGAPSVAVALVTLRPNVWYSGPVALLDELYVAPDLRGHGIGSKVIDRLLTEARERSVSLVEINVDEGDEDARRFYERHGFAATEPGSDERALYYSRELE